MRRLSIPTDLSAPKLPGSALTLTLELLTPMFGGGVRVMEHQKPIDPVTPIRAPSIRGQLRFWWRAVNPRRHTTWSDLLAAESQIFGGMNNSTQKKDGAAHRSKLVVRVLSTPKVTPLPILEGPFGAKPGYEDLAYGAFPLRRNAKQKGGLSSGGSGAVGEHGVLHKLTGEVNVGFIYPDELALDLEAAVWAWTSFGGLGGRTRRGFGAVAIKDARRGDLPWKVPSVAEGWARFELAGAPAVEWPHLRGMMKDAVASRAASDGLAAQKRLLAALKRLRQGAGLGRNPGHQANRPGRSRWPEADAIRAIHGAPLHHDRQRLIPVDKFPRGSFGMPIIFHFKTGTGEPPEPPDATLRPAATERLASPLVLRPYREPGSSVVYAQALRLHGKTPPVELHLKGADPVPVSMRLTSQEVQQIGPLGGETDPITRYMKELLES